MPFTPDSRQSIAAITRTNDQSTIRELAKRVKERGAKRQVVRTVEGKAAAIIQDAKTHQRLLDIAAQADPREGIREGLQQALADKTRPVREFFAEFESRWKVNRSREKT